MTKQKTTKGFKFIPIIPQVTGLMTQGREEVDEWVSAYSVSYSSDAFKWNYVVDGQGNRRVFRGNVDPSTVRYNLLDPPLQTRFVRLHVIEWRGRPSLRLEIVGCQGNRNSTCFIPQPIHSMASVINQNATK